jgi:hypothetical protein
MPTDPIRLRIDLAAADRRTAAACLHVLADLVAAKPGPAWSVADGTSQAHAETITAAVRLDATSGVPFFHQIADSWRLRIRWGLLPVGHPLPSTRDHAAQLGVNPMTVSKAYSFLRREGLIERRRGRLYTVAKE